ncbi:MAG: hypothetical protein ACPHUF_05745 [Gammaproteobacteria bacterium]|jgi:hypothetical protein
MSTGSFENFAGTITEIGPLYPFVGSEMILVGAAVIFWLWWHISEMRIEKREYEEEVERYGDQNAIKKRLDAERD